VKTVLSTRTWQLLHLLADGKFHSGVALAAHLNVSRATVFNALQEAEAAGVLVQRGNGRGYRLCEAWTALEVSVVAAELGAAQTKFKLEILRQATSSNALLLQRASANAVSGSVLAVELQTAGRGRIGRTWHTGLGNALTFSLLWRFECGLNALSGLSLAVGVAIVRALRAAKIDAAQLKWPNDVVCAEGKIGGVLIEAQGDMMGPCAVVIGIGINCSLPLPLAQRIDQAASALNHLTATPPSRNQLLAMLLRELASVLDEFAAHGLHNLRAEWQDYHAYQNLPISLSLPDGSAVTGTALGITERGELSVQSGAQIRQFNSGEVGTSTR
jgi:BirA family biotin operon repressor/biotin-[acetyl-CoA-carboxylase] ligase